MDSREERGTKDTSGVMEPRGNMEPVGISGETIREPMVVGGCPQSEGGMKNGDKQEESTTVNTVRSTAWEEVHTATVIASGQRDTPERTQRAFQWRGRITPQWHKAEGMGHHMMDTREGNPRPLGSSAKTTNSEGEEPGRGERTLAYHPSRMMGHQPKHGWGVASPQIKGMEGSNTRH